MINTNVFYSILNIKSKYFVLILVVTLSILAFICSFIKLIFHLINRSKITDQKKNVTEDNENFDNLKILKKKLNKTLNLENVKKKESISKFDAIQNTVFNSLNSKFVSKQLSISLINKRTQDSSEKSCFTDLASISKSGAFVLAPNTSESNLKKISRQRQPFTPKLTRKTPKKFKLFIKTLLKKRKNIHDEFYCLFNLNSSQQKYFLNFYGHENNPVLIAKDEYNRKLLSKKNHSDLNANKADNFEPELWIENLNNTVESYLKNSQFNRVMKCDDMSDGLGRKPVYRIRKLEYVDEGLLKKKKIKRLKKSINIPRINFELYNFQDNLLKFKSLKKKKLFQGKKWTN